MVAICNDTIARLAEEAHARAARVADISGKVEWRHIAGAYIELAQIERGRVTLSAGQTNDPMRQARLYLEQAERARELSLRENRTKWRDNLLALAENYHLLHDRFLQLGRSHRCEALHPNGETVGHLARPGKMFGERHSAALPKGGIKRSNLDRHLMRAGATATAGAGSTTDAGH